MAAISHSLPLVANSNAPLFSWGRWTVSLLKNPYILAAGAIALLALFIYRQLTMKATAILCLDSSVTNAIKDELKELAKSTDIVFISIIAKDTGEKIFNKPVYASLGRPLFLSDAPVWRMLTFKCTFETDAGFTKPFSKTIDFVLYQAQGIYSIYLDGRVGSAPLKKIDLPPADLSIEPLLNQPLPFDRNINLTFASSTGICTIHYDNRQAPGWIYLKNQSSFYQIVTFTLQDTAKNEPPMEKILVIEPGGPLAYHSTILQSIWEKSGKKGLVSLLSVKHQAYTTI